MAKDNRTIHSAVRFGGKVFKPGQEDELEAALDAKALDRLADKGAISGFGTTKSKTAAVVDEPVAEPAEEAPKKGKGK